MFDQIISISETILNSIQALDFSPKDISLAFISAFIGLLLPSAVRLCGLVFKALRRRSTLSFAEGDYFVYRSNAGSRSVIIAKLYIRRAWLHDYSFTYRLENSNIPPAHGHGYFADGKVVLLCAEKFGESLIIFKALEAVKGELIELAVYCGIRAVDKLPHAGFLLISSKELDDERVKRVLGQNSCFMLAGTTYLNRKSIARQSDVEEE